ncbi:hypothetical protein BOX15_Mlig025765g2, partial [Macrostomum lignano]
SQTNMWPVALSRAVLGKPVQLGLSIKPVAAPMQSRMLASSSNSASSGKQQPPSGAATNSHDQEKPAKTKPPHPDAPKEPLEAFPNNVNPLTGEIEGPRGPEPTRFGDWERKGRCIDF